MQRAELFDCRVHGSISDLMAGFWSGEADFHDCLKQQGFFGPRFVNNDLPTRSLQL